MVASTEIADPIRQVLTAVHAHGQAINDLRNDIEEVKRQNVAIGKKIDNVVVDYRQRFDAADRKLDEILRRLG